MMMDLPQDVYCLNYAHSPLDPGLQAKGIANSGLCGLVSNAKLWFRKRKLIKKSEWLCKCELGSVQPREFETAWKQYCALRESFANSVVQPFFRPLDQKNATHRLTKYSDEYVQSFSNYLHDV